MRGKKVERVLKYEDTKVKVARKQVPHEGELERIELRAFLSDPSTFIYF